MSKYTVEYSTENPAYEYGRTTWKFFICFLIVITFIGVM